MRECSTVQKQVVFGFVSEVVGGMWPEPFHLRILSESCYLVLMNKEYSNRFTL